MAATHMPPDRTPRAAASVRLEDVCKSFGPIVAIDRISLEVPAGRLVTLLGPSGCGKTTTLRVIAGLEAPTRGRVFIGGEDVTPLPAAQRRVTMVFQSYALFPHLTVFENVAFGLRLLRQPEAEVRRRVEEALALVGLEGTEGRFPARLSGGQQQRVSLARALVMEPAVILFDEPLSNLDAKLRKHVRAEIRELQRRLGITAVYVTHDQAEALSLSDIIVVMHMGRVEQVGTPEELYRRPSNRFVADFIGEANLLPATYHRGEVVVATYRLPYQQEGITDGDWTLLVRPEAVRLDAGDEGLPGTVRTAAYLGVHIEYRIETPVGMLFAIGPADRAQVHPVGSRVTATFDVGGIYLLAR
ncbi:MAG: ABC transporter ATP-binding protein [Armatimonadota bacterium]|nr:ABC transporter ATP-binding protein [Armatimonadota bacterium]